jgi:4,5-DOPA dioxygenase extradiol
MNNKTLPSIFVSHGAPTLVLEENPAHLFLKQLGADLIKNYGKPAAILAVSAHWETQIPTVSASEKPETIYDFGGFAPELFEITYPAPGSPQLARRVGELLEATGFSFRISPTRGFDHGAWVPLKLMFPAADIPVAQFSVLRGESPQKHYEIGRMLAELRKENVLILGLGSLTHNLFELNSTNKTPVWAQEFDNWFDEKLMSGDLESILNYERLAPNAERAHPTPEHLLPIFTALGAGNFPAEKTARLHQSWTFGSLSMASYSFGNL